MAFEMDGNGVEKTKKKKNRHLGDDKLRSSNSQEIHFPVISHISEKLENFKPFETGDRRGMENKATQREHESLPPEPKFDLRKSLAWDSAFFTSPGVLDSEELLETVNLGDVDNSASDFGPREHVYLSSQSLEPERTSRVDKSSLRRSLAWDSAFFTSAGVLDSEELCIINKGLKKSETHGLPGIKELQRSVESNSTMDSDSFSLESLEYELFEGIRMSQQKSSKASNTASSRCNLRRGTALKKLDVSSRSRAKPVSASIKQSVNMHGLERTTKEASAHPQGPRVQHTARSLEFNPSSLKPPKIVGRANPISVAPSKRATFGANQVKMEDKSTKDASGQHVTVSKKPCLRNERNVIPISAPPPKSPRLGSSTPTKGCAMSSSPYRGVNGAPDNSSKSPSSSLRRNLESRNVADGSTLTSPLRYSARNRSELAKLSLPKSSSCTSLASSIDSSLDGWSFESSSSTLVSQRSYICKKNQDTTRSRGFPFDHDATQTSEVEPSRRFKEISAGSSPDHTDISRNFKRSGLRMPSPKLGFFDVMNPPSPNGGLHYQSGVMVTSPRDATGPGNLDSAANSIKHAKLPAQTTSRETGNAKLGSQKIRILSPVSSIRPTNLNQFEVENTSSKVSPVPGTLRSSFAKAQNGTFHNMSYDKRLETEKVGTKRRDAAEHDPGSSPKAKNSGTERFLKNKTRREPERKGQVCGRTKKQSLKRPAENSLLGSESEKENLFSFQGQVNSLRKHMQVVDLRGDVVMELK